MVCILVIRGEFRHKSGQIALSEQDLYHKNTAYHEKLYTDPTGRMNGRAIQIVST